MARVRIPRNADYLYGLRFKWKFGIVYQGLGVVRVGFQDTSDPFLKIDRAEREMLIYQDMIKKAKRNIEKGSKNG